MTLTWNFGIDIGIDVGIEVGIDVGLLRKDLSKQ